MGFARYEDAGGGGGGQIRNRKTKLALPKMSNYKNPFKFLEQCVPKKNNSLNCFENLVKIIPFLAK